jgi:malonate transporter and related proteins
MLATVGALAPVFLMIALGALLRARGLVDDAFWAGAERLVYRLLLPALLVLTTAGSDFSEFRVLPVAAALIAAILLTAGLAVALRPWLGIDDAAFTSAFQGAIRTNSYVGLAGAGALYGEAGFTVMGIVVFVVITAVNVLSVVALIWYGARPSGGREVAALVLQNPLILACLIGFALNAAGIGLPGLAHDLLEILGRASLPLGLLCVGAGLDLSRASASPRAISAVLALKLLIMPAATAAFCVLFGVEGVTAGAAVLFTAVPVSASAYVLARQLGGDAPLMAGLITLTTLAAFITMPITVALFT